MPFRPPKKQPTFADLKGILAQTKQQTEGSLYQTVEQIIDRLTQLQQIVNERLDAANPDNPLSNVASKFATYHTKNDDRSVLPNSIQLLAGLGIEFDDTVPGKRTIKSTGGAGYDAPLTDGDVNETHLIFAAGECIIVQVPNIE